MLRSQIYSLVDDRTMVDRELDELRYALADGHAVGAQATVDDVHVLLVALQHLHKSYCCPHILGCVNADSIIQSGS